MCLKIIIAGTFFKTFVCKMYVNVTKELVKLSGYVLIAFAFLFAVTVSKIKHL